RGPRHGAGVAMTKPDLHIVYFRKSELTRLFAAAAIPQSLGDRNHHLLNGQRIYLHHYEGRDDTATKLASLTGNFYGSIPPGIISPPDRIQIDQLACVQIIWNAIKGDAESRAERSRATARAKAILKPGDRITGTRCNCGSTRQATYTFSYFDGQWIVTNSGHSDLHGYYVTKVNGQPVSFRDPPTVPSSVTHTNTITEAALQPSKLYNETEGRDGYLIAGKVRFYYVYKQAFPMSFIYGLNAMANRETSDPRQMIDVRELPGYREVTERCTEAGLRNYHQSLFGQLIAEGFDFDAHAIRQHDEAIARWKREAEERKKRSAGLDLTDDDFPF
ncbi:MAG: hypothetical protein QM667_13365, partial [Asticcacaulis sp.]